MWCIRFIQVFNFPNYLNFNRGYCKECVIKYKEKYVKQLENYQPLEEKLDGIKKGIRAQ